MLFVFAWFCIRNTNNTDDKHNSNKNGDGIGGNGTETVETGTR